MDRGFTIIEMLVAVAVFAIVMVLALSSLLNVNDMLSRAEAFRVANDNFGLALEMMMRDIRTGTNYDVDAGDTEFKFKSPLTDDDIVYRLSGQAIERCNNAIDDCSNGSSFLRVTAPEAKVLGLRFFLNGVGSDGIQPHVTIIINGYTGAKKKTRAYFNLQTTVSQRELES